MCKNSMQFLKLILVSKFWCLERGPGHSLLNLGICAHATPNLTNYAQSARALTKVHIPPNHSDRDHVDDDNDHHQWWSFTPFNHFNFVSFVHTLVTNFVTLSYYHNDNDNDNIIIMVMIMIMIMIVYDAYDVRWWSLTMNDCQHSPKTRQTVPWRDLKATTTILTSEAGDLPQTSRTSHQHCHSTPQRHYLNNVWGLA